MLKIRIKSNGKEISTIEFSNEYAKGNEILLENYIDDSIDKYFDISSNEIPFELLITLEDQTKLKITLENEFGLPYVNILYCEKHYHKRLSIDELITIGSLALDMLKIDSIFILGHEVKITPALDKKNLDEAIGLINDEILNGSDCGSDTTRVGLINFDWTIVQPLSYIEEKIKYLEENNEVVFEHNQKLFKVHLRCDEEYDWSVFDFQDYVEGDAFNNEDGGFFEGTASQLINMLIDENTENSTNLNKKTEKYYSIIKVAYYPTISGDIKQMIFENVTPSLNGDDTKHYQLDSILDLNLKLEGKDKQIFEQFKKDSIDYIEM